MKILVVEDSTVMQLALAWFLNQSGHEAYAVANGEEALHRLSDEEFGLVITDFRMPRMGGLELMGFIQQIHGDRIKVIGMSASDDCQDQFLAAGADAYIDKPIDSEKLLALLEQFQEAESWPLNTVH